MDRTAVDDRVLGGRYRLGALLGSGGMALVYDAWDQRLARPVAVKVLRPELAAAADVRLRFETEARAAARLSHPNAVAVYDAGDDRGRAYIVMERLRGESLADTIARGPMDLTWLHRLAGEVLAALEAAHQAGIVHRDIKPGNILLGPDGRAKVADFGIARISERSATALTGAGLVVGTTAYLAPERVMGQPATAQSDLYSFGVVLYEALTGRKPFEGTTPAAVAAAAVHRGAADPSILRPDADPQLVAVIGRAMAVDPACRYASAADMTADLRRPAHPPTAILPALPAAPAVPVPTALPAVSGEPNEVRRPRRRWVAAAFTALVAAAVVVVVVAAILVARSSGSGSQADGQGVTGTTVVAASPPATPQATSVTTAPAPTATTSTDPIAMVLQQVAARLAQSDSAAAGQLAAGLIDVAETSDPSARAMAATTLLDQTVQWYREGQLTTFEYVETVGVLRAAGASTVVAPPGRRRTGDPGGRGI